MLAHISSTSLWVLSEMNLFLINQVLMSAFKIGFELNITLQHVNLWIVCPFFKKFTKRCMRVATQLSNAHRYVIYFVYVCVHEHVNSYTVERVHRQPSWELRKEASEQLWFLVWSIVVDLCSSDFLLTTMVRT